MAGHSPSGFSGREQNSWFYELRQVVQVLKQQTAPDHHATTTIYHTIYHAVGMMFYARYYAYLSKSQFFFLSFHEIFSQKSWGSSRCFMANVRWAFVFFLVSSDFHLGTLPWMLFLPSLFLIVES